MEHPDLTYGSEEWKEARYEYVTATDIGKILGVDTNISRKKLLELKVTRKEKDVSQFSRVLMDLGRGFESSAIRDFEKFYRSKYGAFEGRSPLVLFVHEKIPYFAGTPDFVIRSPTPKVVEIKCHFFPSVETACPYYNEDEIPLKYYLQVQGYLELMNLDEGVLFSWTLFNGFSVFRVVRDKFLWETIIMPHIDQFCEWMRKSAHSIESAAFLECQREARWKSREKEECASHIYHSLVDHVKCVYRTNEFSSY